MLRREIETYLSSLDRSNIDRYLAYWESIKPTDHEEYYMRWIFAFLSIHTTWRKNVDSYVLLTKEKSWRESSDQLSTVIKNAGVGLHGMRTRGIWEFTQAFWQKPENFYKQDNESWMEFRDRLVEACYGIGLAKVSFALEMAYPKDCGVVCVDTHIIQLYGQDPQKLTDKQYRNIEAHWIKNCKKLEIPSPIARHIYWDKVQEQPDTKYWSYVFEKYEPKNQTTMDLCPA
jgi:thermostable 8-oxoguanine DNA glycosylase